MNPRRILFFLLVLVYILMGILLGVSSFNPKYTKVLKFQLYTIEYEQYYFQREKLWEGHYVDNEMLFRQANLKLAQRLCREYRIKPNARTGKKIKTIANDYCFVDTTLVKIDSLVSNSSEIFDTIIYIF